MLTPLQRDAEPEQCRMLQTFSAGLLRQQKRWQDAGLSHAAPLLSFARLTTAAALNTLSGDGSDFERLTWEKAFQPHLHSERFFLEDEAKQKKKKKEISHNPYLKIQKHPLTGRVKQDSTVNEYNLPVTVRPRRHVHGLRTRRSYR